jgi:hypothetical protein
MSARRLNYSKHLQKTWKETKPIVCTQILPTLPTEIWLIIYDYILGRSHKMTVQEYYYELGFYHEQRRKRYSAITSVMRLVCKRFARIITRPAPNYDYVATKIYQFDPDVMFGSLVIDNSRYIVSTMLTILGILYALLGVKFKMTLVSAYRRTDSKKRRGHTNHERFVRVLSREYIKTKAGIFGFTFNEVDYSVRIKTPYDSYDITNNGIVLLSDSYDVVYPQISLNATNRIIDGYLAKSK